MGFQNCSETDKVFNRYVSLTNKVLSIDITDSNKRFDRLALTIYKILEKEIEGIRMRNDSGGVTCL